MAKLTLCTKSASSNAKIAMPGSKNVFGIYRPTTKTVVDGKPVDGTCPRECSLLKVCYANSGMVNIQQAAAAKRQDNVKDYISSLPNGAKLRHLVSGDLFKADKRDLTYMREMIAGHKERPDVVGWGYTHGWQRLKSSDINTLPNLVINASCDNEAQILEATAKGWDAVTIVPAGSPSVVETSNYKRVTCPVQTLEKRGKAFSCEQCMLCAKPKRKTASGKPIVIAFEGHGSQKKTVLQRLELETI